MVKAVDNGTANGAPAAPAFTQKNNTAERETPEVAELVAAALARLRRDLDAYDPSKPAIAYALAGETHAVMLHHWHQRSPEEQTAFLSALLDDVSGLLHQVQARLARMAPTNSFMFGLHEEAIRLEAQAEITLEEIHRIEEDLRTLEAGQALH